MVDTVGSPTTGGDGTAKDTEQPHAGGDGTAKEAEAPNGTDKGADEDASAGTAEQLKALLKFRQILTQLVSRSTEGLENKDPPKLTRNPFVILVRWFQREPGFEDTVAKYASMLPILETSAGTRYSEMALIGIMALQARQLEIAKSVYADVRFQTTTSAALNPVMKGVGLIVLCLVVLSATVVGIVLWRKIDVGTISPEFLHSIVAFGFGCLGGVVSLLSRLSEFAENKQVRSREFLVAYGFTLPVVGGGFALVLAAVLDAKIISILDNRTQLFIVIGFLAGFSERFTQQILKLVEVRFFSRSGQQGQDSTQQ